MSGLGQGNDLKFLAGQLAEGVKLLREALIQTEKEVDQLRVEMVTVQHQLHNIEETSQSIQTKQSELLHEVDQVKSAQTNCLNTTLTSKSIWTTLKRL